MARLRLYSFIVCSVPIRPTRRFQKLLPSFDAHESAVANSVTRPPGMDWVANPKLTQCPSSVQLPHFQVRVRLKGAHLAVEQGLPFSGIWGIVCGTLSGSHPRVPRNDICHAKSTLAPFATLPFCIQPQNQTRLALANPVRPYSFALVDSSLSTKFVRRTRCAACRSCTSRIQRCGLDADLGPKNARSEPRTTRQPSDEDSDLASVAASGGPANTVRGQQ